MDVILPVFNSMSRGGRQPAVTLRPASLAWRFTEAFQRVGDIDNAGDEGRTSSSPILGSL